MSKDYKKLKIAFADDPEMLRQLAHEELMEKMSEKPPKEPSIKEVLERVAFLKGEQGEKGEKGEQGNEGIQGMKGERGEKGDMGERGKNADEKEILNKLVGMLPTVKEIAAVVEPPAVDIDSIIEKVLHAIPKPTIPLTIDEIVKEIKTNRLLELRDIRGTRLDMNDQRWHGGGLSNITGLIVAGTNVTITGSGTASDPYVINSSGSGSGGVTSINADTTAAQILAVGSAGTDFAIVDNGIGTHTFNLPTASHTNRGALSSADWDTFNGKQNALTFGNLTDVGTDGITIGNGSGAVIGAGTTISQHVADATHNGYLSSTDWSTFNNKGSGTVTNVSSANGDLTVANPTTTPILTVVSAPKLTTARNIAITGDLAWNVNFDGSGNVTAAGTLATVNSNVGSFTYASITVDAKGRITAASSGTAPVTSVSGTTNRITSSGGTTPVIDISASYVGQASITTLGTISTGTWSATNIALAKGGTGSSLSDPGANRLWGWDDTDNSIGFWTIGTNLSYDHATHTLSATGGSGSPGGSDTQVQFNDSGSFGGSNLFTFDKNTGFVITGDVTTSSSPPDINLAVYGSSTTIGVAGDGVLGFNFYNLISAFPKAFFNYEISGDIFDVFSSGSMVTNAETDIQFFSNNGQISFITNNATSIEFDTNGVGRMVINGSGNVSIGNLSPVSLFNIGSTSQFQVNSSGTIPAYGGIATVSNGVPSEYATIDSTGLTANVGATTLYAVPAAQDGMYRVSAYVVLTTAASVSSTLPNVQIVYTDKDSNTSVTIDATPILGVAGIGQTGALTTNTVGTVASGVIPIFVKASTTIQYKTVNYASTAAGMAYALHIKLEKL